MARSSRNKSAPSKTSSSSSSTASPSVPPQNSGGGKAGSRVTQLALITLSTVFFLTALFVVGMLGARQGGGGGGGLGVVGGLLFGGGGVEDDAHSGVRSLPLTHSSRTGQRNGEANSDEQRVADDSTEEVPKKKAGAPSQHDDDSSNKKKNGQSSRDSSSTSASASSLSLLNVKWRGAKCIRGGILSSSKLPLHCKKGRVEKGWCDRIADASSAQSLDSLCGQYVAGNFSLPSASPSEILSFASLEALRKELMFERIGSGKEGEGSSCRSPTIFGGTVAKGSVAFSTPSSSSSAIDGDGEQHGDATDLVLTSKQCPRSFKYLPAGASFASILHYHAVAAGRNGKGKGAGGQALSSPTFLSTDRRGILLTGDSMMRQLLLNIIANVRGDRQPMDHYFHTDAVYFVYADRDELVVIEDKKTLASNARLLQLVRQWFPGYYGEGEEHTFDHPLFNANQGMGGAPLFAILYLWDNKPDTHRTEPFRMHRLSLHIASFMYWWNNKGKLEEIFPYTERMSKHLALNKGQRYIYTTTPWTAEGTFGGVLDAIRIPRNEHMTKWVAGDDADGGSGEGREKVQQKFLLDYSGIADANNPSLSSSPSAPLRIRKTPDGIHYSCIWLPKYPLQALDMKDNGMGCKDPMNTAVSQWLMALLMRL